MSASPQKETDVEPGVQSPDDNEPSMDREAQDTQAQGLGYEFEVKEQDRWLPIANVARIMKTALPENAKIAKEAKECMQECVSEFISFITSEASEKCQQEKRKTVNGEDILFAMTSLGFENYAEALKIYLARYRETLIARGENQNKPPTGASNNPNDAATSSSSATGAAAAGNGSSSSNVVVVGPGSGPGAGGPAVGGGLAGPAAPPPSGPDGAAPPSAGPNAPSFDPAQGPANHNVLSAGLDAAEADPTAFAHYVGHNGSAGEF